MTEPGSSGTSSGEKRYTYREYLEHFARAGQQNPTHEVEDREPSEVGKDMAKRIIERLLAHR